MCKGGNAVTQGIRILLWKLAIFEQVIKINMHP